MTDLAAGDKVAFDHVGDGTIALRWASREANPGEDKPSLAEGDQIWSGRGMRAEVGQHAVGPLEADR